MKSFWILSSILILGIVMYSCTSQRNTDNVFKAGEEDLMQESENALMSKDFDTVIELLTPALDNLEKKSEQGEAFYLLGKAYFMRADERVSHLSNQARMFQPMPSETISDFLKAYEHFMDAAWVVENRDLLVEIYYFAGRTQDVGYLQDFKKASEHYKSAFSISATNEYGKKALERYAILAKWFDKYNEK